MDIKDRIAEVLRAQIENISEDDRRWPAPWSAQVANLLMSKLGLMEERRTCADGSGGVSSRCDAAGRIISTTTSGRSPTEMRRYVTAWEVSREAVEHSHTHVYDEPITITSQQ